MRTALRRLRATDRSVNAVNPATRLPNTCLERALRYRYVLNMPENGKTRDERGFEALESSSGGFVHLDRRPRPDEARDFDGDLGEEHLPASVARRDGTASPPRPQERRFASTGLSVLS